MKKCRRASAKLDILRLHGDKLDDFDSLMGYALKYMRNLKHVDLDMADKTAVSSDLLESFLKGYQGQLETFQWMAMSPSLDRVADMTKDGEVWNNLHGLKVLRLMGGVSFGSSLHVVKVIQQQQSSLQSLGLSGVVLGRHVSPWSRNDCRALSRATTQCKNIVRLDLTAISLRDSDLDIFVPSLSNIRILGIVGHPKYGGHLTDKCCKLISRTCPNLQILDLRYQRNITVTGLKRSVKGCLCLRSMFTSAKLQPKDVVTLVCDAPKLVHLTTESGFDQPSYLKMIEETNGWAVFRTFGDSVPNSNLQTLPNDIRKEYLRTDKVVGTMERRYCNPRIISAWEFPEADELRK